MDVDNVINALESGDFKYLGEHQVQVNNLADRFSYAMNDMSGRSFAWLISHNKSDKQSTWNKLNSDAAEVNNTNVIAILIKIGHFNNVAYHTAIQEGNLNLIKWLWNYVPIRDTIELRKAVREIFVNEQFDIFTWVINKANQNGINISDAEIISVIPTGTTLDWLANNGYSFTCDELNQHLNLFGNDDNFTVLKWLHSHGCKINRKFIEEAASGGALDVLKWVYTNNVPLNNPIKFTDTMLSNAVSNGHIETANWLYSIGIRLNNRTLNDMLDILLPSDYLKSITWLHQHGYKFTANDLYKAIIANPAYKIMNYLDSLGIRGEDAKMIRLINQVKYKEDEYLLWLYNHNYPVPRDKIDMLSKLQN